MIGEQAQNGQQASADATGTSLSVDKAKTVTVSAKRTGATHRRLETDGEGRVLTPCEKRVLRALCDPKNHEKTQREKARIARVSEACWYATLADPWFRQRERELMHAHLHDSLAPIMKASIDTARKPGRDGFADRRMLLETAEVYVPRSQVDHKHSGQVIVGVVGVSMDQL